MFPPPHMTLKAKKRHIREAGMGGCPYCDADLDESGLFDEPQPEEDGTIVQGARCTACKRQWRDVFTLTDVQEVQGDVSTHHVGSPGDPLAESCDHYGSDPQPKLNYVGPGNSTREEAFALHMNSLFNDLVNNHVGLLCCCAERMSPDVQDDVQGSLKEFLERQADALRTKLARATKDIREFVGGEENFGKLKKEDFDADYLPSSEGWRTNTYDLPKT